MRWFNNSDTLIIYDDDTTGIFILWNGICIIRWLYFLALNTYWGGSGQQTTSCVSQTSMWYLPISSSIVAHNLSDQDCYQRNAGCFAVYGFEYKPGFDDAFITWLNDDKKAWTVRAGGLVADGDSEIGPRPVPQEPMVCIHRQRLLNLYSVHM